MSMFWFPAFDPNLEDPGDADDRAWDHIREQEPSVACESEVSNSRKVSE